MSYIITTHVPAHDVTTTYFEFDELDQAAKETVVHSLLDDPFYFWADIESEKSWTVDEHFTLETRPEWQADFSFCQGDGLNLYGNLWWSELLHVAGIEPGFDANTDDVCIEFPANRHYTYSLWNISYPFIITDALEEAELPYNPADVDAVCKAMHKYSNDLYRYGEWLIIDGYYDPAIYDGQLFDSNGEYVCTIDELPRIAEPA